MILDFVLGGKKKNENLFQKDQKDSCDHGCKFPTP